MNSNSFLEGATDIVDTDRSVLKISLVVLAAVLTAGLTGFFFESGRLICAAVLAVLFLVIFILQNLFIKGFDKLFLAALLEGSALALPFYNNLSGYTVLAATLAIALLFKASFDSRKELEATIKVRFFKVSRLSLNSAMPALVLFLLVMFTMKGGLFTEEGVNLLLRPFTPIAQRYAPGFSSSMPTSELLNNIIISNLSEADVKDLNKLPLWAQNQLIAKSVDGLKERVENFIGSGIDLQKPVSVNVYNALHSGYGGLNSTSRTILIVVVLLLLFSLIRSLIPFIHAPIALLAFVLYEVLLTANFFIVQLESRSREVIILK